jgi:hypothetical protein
MPKVHAYQTISSSLLIITFLVGCSGLKRGHWIHPDEGGGDGTDCVYLEFQVNTWTADSQGLPSITSLSNGGFVVVWESYGQDGSGYGVYGRIFKQ